MKAGPLTSGAGVYISINDLAVKISTLVQYEGVIKYDTAKPNGFEYSHARELRAAIRDYRFSLTAAFGDNSIKLASNAFPRS